MGRERQDVRDHPAVGEDLGRVADRIDERLVEPALVDDRTHLREKRGTGFGKLRPHLRDALARSASKSYGRS